MAPTLDYDIIQSVCDDAGVHTRERTLTFTGCFTAHLQVYWATIINLIYSNVNKLEAGETEEQQAIEPLTEKA